MHCPLVAGTAQYVYTQSGQCEAEAHQPVHPFAVEECHQYCSQYGIHKQDGAGYACIHIHVGEVEQYRRACHQEAQQQQRPGFVPADAQADSLLVEHQPQHGQ